MKLFAAVALSMCFSAAHASPETDACDAHRQALERQMATLLSQDHSAQLDALQAALDKTNAECAPDAIAQRRADALKRHDDAVAEARNRLRDWEAELARAQKKGTDQLNIAAWERKVNRARADLNRAVARPI
jgi:small-conductance mechanosensitive channel